MQHLRRKKYSFNAEKDSKLLQERGIGFEEIIDAISDGSVLAFMPHSNQQKYPGQYMLHVLVDGKVYAVPCVEQDEDSIFLKTIFASRKARKIYFPND